MDRLSVEVINDFNTVLNKLSELKVTELEYFSNELNALITRKKTKSASTRIKELYQLLDETVLHPDTEVIFDTLAEKLHNETMTTAENRVYLKIAAEEAKLRNQRVTYLIELSQLRQIPFPQLIEELGLKPLPHA